jgi:hypothetical protein
MLSRTEGVVADRVQALGREDKTGAILSFDVQGGEESTITGVSKDSKI